MTDASYEAASRLARFPDRLEQDAATRGHAEDTHGQVGHDGF